MGQNKRRGRSIIRPRLAVYTAAIEIIPHNHHDDRHTPDGAAAETGRTCPVAVVAVPAEG
jgi:hypothetical protein